MDNFEAPVIPKIFVAPKIISTESEGQTNPFGSALNASNKENPVQNDSKLLESEVKKESTSQPQLCANCSQILLSYFMPLQQYVNEVVQIAKGGRIGSPQPLISLLNTDVLKSQIQNQYSAQNTAQNNEVNNLQNSYQNSPQQQYTQIGSNVGSQTNQTNSSYTETNVNQNQYQNQNQNQNQNQSQNWNQNYQSSDQNLDRTEQNNVSQSWTQTTVVPNGSQGYSENTDQTHITTTSNEPPVSTSEDKQNTESNRRSESRRKTSTHSIGSDRSRRKSRKAQNQEQRQIVSDNNEGMAQNISEERSYESSRSVGTVHSASRQESYGEEAGSSSVTVMKSPYAFVTIAYNNLSATNAIILANSLILTNNQYMNVTDKNGDRQTIQIPFIILIGANIDNVLKDAIYMVFDEVILEPMDMKLSLLSDQSFGIQQFKLQLWKELINFEKCVYLESSTLVVGKITNLFEECWELSACVDWIFPDYFNCSVFVFEPSLTTYEQIISFAIFHQKCSAQKEEGVGDQLDEMTLLNQFFGPKWNRISFVYNYVKNDAIYTQMPAFMKYGDSIKIVNFGHMMSQMIGMTNQSGVTSVHPWHIMFDLLASGQQDVIKSLSIDNFSKFYLNCFVQRLWPILQNHLTPLLINKYGIGRREWSIFDLIRLLSNESGMETDDHMFTQTPITFRRIKSPSEKITTYDNLSIEDEDDYLAEELPNLLLEDLKDVEEELHSAQTTEQTEEDRDTPKTSQQPQPQPTQQQQDDRSKSEWEAGRIDWMGAHQSDKIILRLKKLIRND